MRYVEVNNYGKGFITHNDQELISFHSSLENIWEVSGDDIAISAWISKVNGSELTEEEFNTAKQYTLDGVYTTSEFLLNALTPSEVKSLLTLAKTDTSITTLVDTMVSSKTLHVDKAEFQTFLDLAESKGLINSNRKASIAKGKRK